MVRNLLLPLGMLCLGISIAWGQAGPVRSRVLVRLKPQVTSTQFIADFSTHSRAGGGAWIEKSLSSRSNIHLMMYDTAAINSEELLQELLANGQVAEVTFDYAVETRKDPHAPNDPNLEDQWGIHAILADKAWEMSTGGITGRGDTIVVAILDSGFDLGHEDLAGNIWYNRKDPYGDGHDNDVNGYVDDYAGWNFQNNSPIHKPDQHGQSVAGIIGAKGNNGKGITGINWNVKLMLFEAKLVSEIIAAYEYITEQRDRYNKSQGKQGAFVVATNASFGINRIFCKDQPLWGSMYDRMGEVGILTAAGAANNAWDVDAVGDMPTTCESKFLLTVLNTNYLDEKHAGSAYGKNSIDMGAPGQNSFTTKPFDNYGSFNGNSAAAPHLAGTIALLYSLPCRKLGEMALKMPMETALRIRRAILENVDQLESLSEYTVTGGRLNAYQSMMSLAKECPPEPDQPLPTTALLLYPNPARDLVALRFSTNSAAVYEVTVLSALGATVHRQRVQPAAAGPQQAEFTVAGWSPGTYFVQVQHGNERSITRLLVW